MVSRKLFWEYSKPELICPSMNKGLAFFCSISIISAFMRESLLARTFSSVFFRLSTFRILVILFLLFELDRLFVLPLEWILLAGVVTKRYVQCCLGPLSTLSTIGMAVSLNVVLLYLFPITFYQLPANISSLLLILRRSVNSETKAVDLLCSCSVVLLFFLLKLFFLNDTFVNYSWMALYCISGGVFYLTISLVSGVKSHLLSTIDPDRCLMGDLLVRVRDISTTGCKLIWNDPGPIGFISRYVVWIDNAIICNLESNEQVELNISDLKPDQLYKIEIEVFAKDPAVSFKIPDVFVRTLPLLPISATLCESACVDVGVYDPSYLQFSSSDSVTDSSQLTCTSYLDYFHVDHTSSSNDQIEAETIERIEDSKVFQLPSPKNADLEIPEKTGVFIKPLIEIPYSLQSKKNREDADISPKDLLESFVTLPDSGNQENVLVKKLPSTTTDEERKKKGQQHKRKKQAKQGQDVKLPQPEKRQENTKKQQQPRASPKADKSTSEQISRAKNAVLFNPEEKCSKNNTIQGVNIPSSRQRPISNFISTTINSSLVVEKEPQRDLNISSTGNLSIISPKRRSKPQVGPFKRNSSDSHSYTLQTPQQRHQVINNFGVYEGATPYNGYFPNTPSFPMQNLSQFSPDVYRPPKRSLSLNEAYQQHLLRLQTAAPFGFNQTHTFYSREFSAFELLDSGRDEIVTEGEREALASKDVGVIGSERFNRRTSR